MTREEITRQALKYMNLKGTTPIGKSVDALVRCPFHKDNTPSLSVNLPKGIYHCFSCRRSGTIEKLFKEYTGESLYKTLGIKIDDFSKLASPEWDYEEEVFNVNDYRINFDPALLSSCRHSTKAKQFLRRRGIPFSIVDKYNIRYAEKIYINNPVKAYTDVIVIPIFEKGTLISMELRSTDPNVPKHEKVRYPKDSSVNTLYELDSLDRKKSLYVVEGLMDLFVMKKYPELQNSTTVFGSGITKRQKQLLGEFDDVIYIPDNDEAGNKTIEWFKEQEMTNISILKVPETFNGVNMKDVGDVESKSGLSLKNLLDRKWLLHSKKLIV